VEAVTEALGQLTALQFRLWRFDGERLQPFAGADSGNWSPAVAVGPGPQAGPKGSAWLAPVPSSDGLWLETSGGPLARIEQASASVLPILGQLLSAERATTAVSEELQVRYEEIDLLYAISDILGRTLRLEEAADTIIREVADLVRARRASIMVYDESAGVLRTVASRGFSHAGFVPVPANDPHSVAAQAWRENRVVAFDPANRRVSSPGSPDGRTYVGEAFLSVPICYAAPGVNARCIGVINLTDRLGTDVFAVSDQRLVTAVASQVGAALENARLVQQDMGRQRLQRELELAHNLQLRLLPAPSVLQGDATVAARFDPAETVGGDFYTFNRLGGGRVGVMLGDVSSHGFSAALIMALVMSAAGIHAGVMNSPDETLIALLDSLGGELASTEMFFSVFYGVLDPERGRLAYSNAGHQHAFRIPMEGEPERLASTSPPLGLAPVSSISRRVVPWSPRGDLLCLWTDGLVDSRNGGAGFTEETLLQAICARRDQPPEAIVEAVFNQAKLASPRAIDDRTLLILRI
jgi:sigma-B regulation protein RsbU (phosphoserine phosphatase)